MSLRRGVQMLGTFLGIVAYAFSVSAHKPLAIGESYPLPSEALVFDSIGISQVVYAELTEVAPLLWLRFDLDRGETLYTSVGAPMLEDVGIPELWIALIGHGLPSETLLPVANPEEGLGGLFFEASTDEVPVAFHEPFTGTDSWILFERTVELTEPGVYYLVAGTSGAVPAKMWISVGRRESFGVRDVLSLPTITRDVRAFHEVPPREGGRLLAKLVFLGLAAAGIALLSGCCRSSA